MNLNILTGFLLCFCFLASISISQSASSNIDTRLRFRRQDEDAGADANADADENAATTGESDKADANEVTTGSADGDSDAATDAATEGGATEAVAEGDAATEAATEAATDAAAEGGATEAATEGDAATEAATEAAEGDAATESATQAAEGEAATEAATEAAGNGDTTEAAAEGDAATESATEAAEGGATTDAGAADTTAAADGDANDATTASADEEKASQESGTDSGVTVEETTAGSAENGTDVSVQPNETEGGDATASADATTNAGDTSGQTIGETVFTADNNNVATSQVPDVSETADNDTSTEAPGAGGDADTTQPSAPQEPAGPGSDARAELRVVVSPATLQVQRGRTVEITCTVYGGSAETSIYWIQDEPERRYAVTDEVSPNDRQVTQSQVSLRARITLDDPSKIGKYTCMAQDNSGNSGSATLTMEETGGRYQPPVYPGYQPSQPQPSGARAYLRIVAPDMRDGDYVEIQCEGAAAEDESRIEWYFNGRLVNDEQPLFPRGKTLYIRPISRGYLGNYRCSIPGGNYMEANSVLTFGGSAPQQPVQPSQPVTGRCSIDEATCRNGRCIPRSYLCDGKDDCGDSSDESCGPASGTGGDSCQPNEISCSDPGRGRKCVQKFWMCDGDRDCDDGSDEQPRYCDLLARPRFCKTSEFQCASYNGTSNSPVCIPRSFQCDGYNDCPDRSDEIGCTKPTIISPPQRQIEINAGSTLTIQCTARGSPAPYINWRLNWGHICRDGHDNGRCQMTQAIDPNDPTFVTGTLTIRNVNINDGGAYSCEALNNQGFIFAIPDAIVNVIIGQQPPQPSYQACNCNGHSTTCTPDGRCLNCQHNTAGTYCEYCATGYQGDARRATAYDCQPITPPPSQYCDPSGTYSERGGRCICKYNVEGDRCDQCKRNHFYLNPGTPNGCLPCFCSGVSSDCSSSDWKRKAVSLSLNNWNAVPKNFATEQYEAGNRIQQRAGGRELALDQSSLGRPASEVLYWKAPKEILGDFVTLYDGNIDIDFVNDGDDRAASNNDEFIWLRGNNIDLVHKVPQGQQLKGNANETYSVACNERTFTRKDGTYIDRENILMALSDVDTFLIKINPAGGRRNAVLRNVRLNLAAADGYADNALTVESCRCPANYTGTSCEKCAEGYGRPHPLVGIYLGQCWSCRSICNDRADRCDRDTGKCQDCQGNTEGDRCEKCRAGFVFDARSNQCVQDGQYQPSSQGVFYIDSREYDPRSQTPFNVVLDGSKTEQRIPLRLNTPTRSVVWGRTDGNPLPNNVFQDGNDLVFRYPSSEQSGHYICTITFPDGTVQHLTVQMDHNQGQPSGQGYGSFNPASPLTLQEGSNQYIQAPSGYGRVQWSRADGQPFAGGVYQNGNDLQITGARPEYGGIYICALYNADGSSSNVPYEVRVQAADRRGGAPKVTIQPKTINLKEGQRMIIQYTVASHDPIKVAWYKWTDQGYQPIPSLFSVEENRLVLNRATLDAAGTYQVVVRNSYGEDRQTLEIKVQPRRGRARGQQAGTPIIRFSQDQYEVGYETIDIAPNLSGGDGATITWTKDGSGYLPDGVTALNDGTLRVAARSSDVDGRYNIDVTNAHGRSSASIYIRWRESSGASGEHGNDQDRARTYADVRFESRDEQSHQVGRDIHLQCNVQTHASRPYEYTYSKDGHALENNVEVHPNGLLIIRNAQASDSGRYRCEVSFPRAPDAGTVESSYDLRFNGGASSHGYQYGADDNQQYASDYLDVTAQPSEAVIGRGQTANITCVVNGAQQYTITWGKYAHDTTLPDYARQQGNSVIVAPGSDAQAEDMYLQCQVDVPGRAQPHHAYARVNIRDGDESSKKMKKKRRS